MATKSARSTRAAKQPVTSLDSSDEIHERIERLHGERNFDAIRDEAVRLTRVLGLQQRQAHKLAAYHEALRAKLDSLMAHEHYTVVITGVERNGRLVAEVAGLGSNRVQVAVHPDVRPEEMKVGATGLVAREHNCLLRVTNSTGRWQVVGTFERYLDSSSRILLRDRDLQLAVDTAHDLRDTPLKKGDLIGYDRDVGMAYQRLDAPKGDHLFDENITDDFANLGGMDKIITRLKRHIDFRFRYPHLAGKYSLKSKCSILFHGAPGNGKTCLARCCAGYVRRLHPDRPCRFMHVAGSSDYNKWFGESEQRIMERFSAVRAAAEDGLVVMFWDEVDAIAKHRGTDYGSGAPDRVLNTYLSQIDGVVPLANVILLYASNRPDMLDSGFLRPGRTDEKIEIPPPNRRAAEAILRCYLGNGLPLASPHDGIDELILPLVSRLFAPNGDYGVVAEVKLNDGRQLPVAGRQLLSGAMLENVVHIAAWQAAVREAESHEVGLTEADLIQALDNELVSAVSLLSPSNVKSYVTSIPHAAHPLAVDPLLTSSSSNYVRAR